MFNKIAKAKLLTTLLILTMATTTVLFLNLHTPLVNAGETPTFYLYPATLTDLKVNDTFVMTIKFENFTQLWVWQAGLAWDPAVLECIKVTFGKEAYPESVFAVLAPERDTLTMKGKINNTIGKIYPPYAESLTRPGEGVNGTVGVGYNLMKIDFKVKGYAPKGSNMTLINTKWTAYPDVGIGKPHNLINATISTISPPGAMSPVANFTWTPPEPIVNQSITFDASSSESGFNGTHTIPITEYRWDFDGDGVFDKNVTTPTTTWNYTVEGDYNVTLEVWAPNSYPPDVPDTGNTTKTITIAPPPPPPLDRPFIYVDPPRVNATTVGEEITVYVKLQDFVQLWVWQAGLQWDPAVLECIKVTFGKEAYPESVFAVLAPDRETIFVAGKINNTLGQIIPYAESLTRPGEGVTGTPDTKYNLMKITFKVKATGIVDLHLYGTYCTFYPYVGAPGKTIIRDMFTVTLPEGDFPIEIITNSTGYYQKISSHAFKGPPENKISFVITCVSKRYYATTTDGFCNVTISNGLMWGEPGQWIIKVNGQVRPAEIQQNGTHNILYFTYPHKTDGEPSKPKDNLIEITSAYAIPEFSPPWLLITLLIATLALALLSKTKSTLTKQKPHYNTL